MADTLDLSCPNCGKGLRVPAALVGKRVKCKGCQQAFAVSAPAPPPPVPAPAAPESGAKPDAPAPAVRQKVTWDDELDTDNTPMDVIKEDETPRCPHCAKEMDPPDAVICLNCGFNNRTRVKAETKKVFAPDSAEWLSHLGPAVLCFILIVSLLVLDVTVVVNMRYWMEGGMLEDDTIGIDGRKKMLISPGLFIMTAIFGSIAIIAPLSKYVYRRLFVNYLPQEVAIHSE